MFYKLNRIYVFCSFWKIGKINRNRKRISLRYFETCVPFLSFSSYSSVLVFSRRSLRYALEGRVSVLRFLWERRSCMFESA